ncbi:MAG: FAD-dependent monooxygenase, partial [Chloroflexota bacterium]|nr:FAD-dependent monooxygenase [Chloroflexota bacterium]
LEPARRTYIITTGLERVLGEVPAATVLHKISTMAVETAEAETEIPLRTPDLVQERKQLTEYLAQSAKKAGAELYLGHHFQGFDQAASSTNLVLKKNENTITAHAGTIIGADGVFSEVARAAGIPAPPVVPLIQAEIALPPAWNPSLTKVWFDVDDTRYFYWLIPESRTQAVVGLIGNPSSDIRALLDNFLDEHGFVAQKYQSGQAAMHQPRLNPWGKVGDVDVLLVGDAAGQVKVTTVGGTVTGFWGAKAAVRSLLGGDSYPNELLLLKRELDTHWYIRTLLERLDNAGYDRLVSCITPAVRQFLARYNRDEMARNFWKLIFVQPRFIPLGLRLLLSSSKHESLPRSE